MKLEDLILLVVVWVAGRGAPRLLGESWNPERFLDPRGADQPGIGLLLLSAVVLMCVAVITTPTAEPDSAMPDSSEKDDRGDRREMTVLVLRTAAFLLGANMLQWYGWGQLLKGDGMLAGGISMWAMILVLIGLRGRFAVPGWARTVLLSPYLVVSATGMVSLLTRALTRPEFSTMDVVLSFPGVVIYYAAFVYAPRHIAGDHARIPIWGLRFALFVVGLLCGIPWLLEL